MALVDYTVTDENTALLTMRYGENRLNPMFLDAMLSVLDEIEADASVEALAVASDHEKIFCNGIDLDWVSTAMKEGRPEDLKTFFHKMGLLFRRMLLYPMPTVAAVNGHVFAAGAVLSLTFDFRLMRADRGYFCLPEVDLGIPFLPSALAICRRIIPSALFNDMQYTGRRLTGPECLENGLVREVCPMEELLEKTVAFASSLKKKRPIVKEMKARDRRDVIKALDVDDLPFIDSGKFQCL